MTSGWNPKVPHLGSYGIRRIHRKMCIKVTIKETLVVYLSYIVGDFDQMVQLQKENKILFTKSNLWELSDIWWSFQLFGVMRCFKSYWFGKQSLDSSFKMKNIKDNERPLPHKTVSWANVAQIKNYNSYKLLVLML